MENTLEIKEEKIVCPHCNKGIVLKKELTEKVEVIKNPQPTLQEVTEKVGN